MLHFIKKNSWLFIAVVLSLLLAGLYFSNKKNNLPIRYLPYYGNKKVMDGDTVYPIIQEFMFTDQLGRPFTKKTLEGKIYVADYFFTTCGSICPVMSKQMKRVYDNFINDNEVIFVSHTVDPETDSVLTLKAYADKLNVSSDKWYFITGNKKELYNLAREGYLLDASQGNGDVNDFIHTQNFALVDKNFQLRGYYDGTDSADIERLILEIKLLKQEYQTTQ